MINCPKCGTANRRGSRFCNECGELLPAYTALACPMCGAMNPVGNAYCDQCNARIIPMASSSEEEKQERPPVKGLSLPTIPLEDRKGKEQPVSAEAEKAKVDEKDDDDWLARLRDSAAEGDRDEIEGEQEVTEDWLGSLRASAVESGEAEPEEPERVAEPVEPVEIPGWLRDLGPIDGQADAAPSGERPATEAAPKKTGAPGEIGAPEEIGAPGEIGAPQAEPALREPEREEAAPAPAEVPDWLREMAPEEAAAPEKAGAPEEIGARLPSVPPLVESPEEEETTETPEWLAELQGEKKEVKAPAQPAPTFEETISGRAAEAEGLARADIPEWLHDMRPRAEEPQAAVSEEPLETEGLLEGLRGVLAPTSLSGARRAPESTQQAEISEASLARAQLLQSLVTQSAEAPQVEGSRRDISTRERVQRWVIMVVLLAVAAILVWQGPGQLWGLPEFPRLVQPIKSDGVDRLDGVIEDIETGEAVLVAFEYGPEQADELNLVARPILRRLHDRGAAISVASTQPMGIAVAGALRSEIASKEQYTPTYESVDYLPGRAAGIARLLADVDARPKLVLILAAQPASLRLWIEQTQTWDESVPLAAGVSAALEPVASPYLDDRAGQLRGMVSGLSGAASYEARRGVEGQATQRLNALAVGHIAIVGLTIVGALLYVFGGPRRREG